VTLIDPRQPQPVQLAAMEALTQYKTSSIEPILLKRWAGYSPEVRRKALESLLTQEPWTVTLLDAIEAGKVPGNQIDANRRALLMEHRNEAIRIKSRKLFEGDVLGARHEVLAKYRTEMASLKGDKVRGHDVYIRECVACHRLGFRDHPIGPNLVTGSFQDPEALLIDIIDPNRYVSPEYIQYVVTDRTGKTHTGFVKLETATGITLQMGDNVQSNISRQDVAEVRSTGKSLMPDGLEKTINSQEMADLIEFILSAQYQLGPETGGFEPPQSK
jgi:putative heme-binding domain-containing protein